MNLALVRFSDRLPARLAHDLCFVPAAVALNDLLNLYRRRSGPLGLGRAGLLAGLAFGALDGVTRLARILDEGGGARQTLVARFTYPPSILLAGGIVYLPGRLLWRLGRRLGVRALAPRATLGLGLVPFLLALYGATVAPRVVRLPRVRLEVEGLPLPFAGLRVAHLSDLHVGPFMSEARLRQVVDRVIEMKPELVVLTGDFINARPDEAVPAARALKGLRAPLGVWASLGNHDRFFEGEAVSEHLRAAGIRVLKNEGVVLEKGGARVWLAGVDDTWSGRADLVAALAERPTGMPVVLLAHDPALFPQAARRGVALTLSGHTHGGQLAMPFLRQLCTARSVTRFVAGIYRIGASTLFVSRGLGLVVPPIRLGAAPEIPTLVLERRAAELPGRPLRTLPA